MAGRTDGLRLTGWSSVLYSILNPIVLPWNAASDFAVESRASKSALLSKWDEVEGVS